MIILDKDMLIVVRLDTSVDTFGSRAANCKKYVEIRKKAICKERQNAGFSFSYRSGAKYGNHENKGIKTFKNHKSFGVNGDRGFMKGVREGVQRGITPGKMRTGCIKA